MPKHSLAIVGQMVRRIRDAAAGPQLLAFLPAMTLGAYWFGGEGFLIIFALVLPAAFAVAGVFSGTGPAWTDARDRETNLRLKAAAEKALAETLANVSETGKTTAALAVELDDFSEIEGQYGRRAASSLLKNAAERLAYALRETDHLVRLDGPRFAIALSPVRRADLETLLQLATRLQAQLSEPFSVDATRVYLTASIGFCLPDRANSHSGAELLEKSIRALEQATANGPGSVRAFCKASKPQPLDGTINQNEIVEALETGQIKPWFQPQVSTDTGELTGFEALARWEHPQNGLILPKLFLPAIVEMGLAQRLCEIMVSRSLAALRHWDRANHRVSCVAVNFSGEELSNPKLTDWIKWELDRYELTPDRLCIEILEDVIARSDDDVMVDNIHSLSDLGCRIDLDDFGTGHASIASIRRFSVHRIKIDRSFVTRMDRDREQQNMVAAILTMAERLDIDTLAEGVETIGEHAILAQLGCRHVQGFAIARPMPFEATEKWMRQHRSKLPTPPAVGKSAS